MKQPLVSFIIVSYNQEAFIREAVEGAFSQDYSPLEIIISDDCSSDRTFDIVREMAAAYRGPHKLIINRNEQNIGVGGNNSRAMGLCHGELFVMAAGDDISLPQRTSKIFQAWNDSGRKATTIYSEVSMIDENGQSRNQLIKLNPTDSTARFLHQQTTALDYVRRRRPVICGCAEAISAKLYSLFGPLPDKICYEDAALSFRTALLGGFFTFITDPLVLYRWHGANTTFGLHEAQPKTQESFREMQKKKKIELDRYVDLYECFASDADRAAESGLISPALYLELKKRIRKEGRRFKLKSDLLTQSWLDRLGSFAGLYYNSIRPREMLENVPYLLPRELYCAAAVAKFKISSKAKATHHS
jgi:glycosyltransferase involved in cell wall biosynthesis